MAMSVVKTALGTSEIGRGICVGDVAQKMMDLYLQKAECLGLKPQVDTAVMYCDGETEKVLGGLLRWKEQASIDSKVNPWGSNSLKADSIKLQVNSSLEHLKISSLDTLYLHAPDHETDLKETLETLDGLYQEGKFKRLGLSNYPSWLVSEVMGLCKANGWVSPSVYQGMYSAITRQVEPELFPCLRYYGIAFYAYSPLGGGILTGKYKFEEDAEKTISKGRFNGIGWDKVYRERYWKEEHFNAIEKLKTLLQVHHPEDGISVIEASIRWLYHHSSLDGTKGDTVIIGSSKIEQLEQNLSFVDKGPLHDKVVEFYNFWWSSTKHLCPSYHR